MNEEDLLLEFEGAEGDGNLGTADTYESLLGDEDPAAAPSSAPDPTSASGLLPLPSGLLPTPAGLPARPKGLFTKKTAAPEELEEGEIPDDGVHPLRKRIREAKGTYLVMVEQLNMSFLESILEAEPFNWRAVSLREAFVSGCDFVFADGKHNFNKQLWKIRATYKYRIVAPILGQKFRMAQMLMHNKVDFFPETFFFVDKDTYLDYPAGVWVWDPDSSFGMDLGGVKMVTSKSELRKAQVDFYKANPTKGALLTRYITDPDLFPTEKGPVKYHFRMYLLVVAGESAAGNKAAVFREGKIAVADEPYQASDFHNKAIHESRIRPEDDIVFPRDFPGGAEAAEETFAKIHNVLSQVIRLTLRDCTHYDEAKNAYELFSCNLVMDRSGKVWLNDILTAPVWRTPKNRDWMSQVLFEGITDFVLLNKEDPRHLAVCTME